MRQQNRRAFVISTSLIGCLTLFFTSASYGQDITSKTISFPRGRNVTAVNDFVGGEIIRSYIVRAKEGQTLTITLTSPEKRAEFSVSTEELGSQVSFGRETQTRRSRQWAGKIPKTGNYYISVTAFPSANYSLRFKLE
jgi:hypothetical protein